MTKKIKIGSLEELISQPRLVKYDTYEFDELSYTCLLMDIRRLLEENKKCKEVINKAKKLHNEFASKNSLLVFENNNLIDFMNNLISVLKEVEHE